MESDKSQKIEPYVLNEHERQVAEERRHAVERAKIQVYEANVALEALRAQVSAATQMVEVEQIRQRAALDAIARAHGFERYAFTPDFSRIDPQ